MSGDPKETRRMLSEIKSSLDAHSREELVEILSYVFKEYVVEGAAPLATGAGAILDARSELDGLSFAQLITWLQSHLDVPELRLFEVAGERVSVRAGGRTVQLQAQEQAEPLAPAGMVRATPPAPSTSAAPAAPASPSTPQTPGQPAPNAAQPAKDEKDSASSRFSLLEVD